MAKIIVTGGTGFIGSHLTSALINDGHDVTVIDDFSTGQRCNVNEAAKLVVSSLEDINSHTFEDIEVVYHLASISGEAVSLFAPSACYKRNAVGSYNVLMNCLRHGIRRLVFTSSMAVYGNRAIPPFSEEDIPNPSDPYGLSKYDTEKLLEIYGTHTKLEWTILRLHNVYGPRVNLNDPYRGVIGIFLNLLLRNKDPVLYSNGNHIRAFTYIDDIIHYIIRAGFEEKFNKEIFNLGSDEKTTLLDLANLLLELTGFDGEPVFYPPRPGELAEAFSSHKKANKLIGFSANTSLIEGLKSTLKWARQQKIDEFDYDLMKTEFELTNKLPITWRNRLL